ncbi:MAG: 2-dehydropantoate 2-reductase, partial [Betaproteobacteria bacterium]
MQRNIAVLGAGAIGSSLGADLTQAGYAITIVDQWPAQVETIRSAGLRVEMTDQTLQIPVRALHLCDLAAANLQFDIVFLAV